MQVTDLVYRAHRFTLFDFRTTHDEPILPLLIGEEGSRRRGGLIDPDQIKLTGDCHWKLSRLEVQEFLATDNGVVVVIVEGDLDEIKELLE